MKKTTCFVLCVLALAIFGNYAAVYANDESNEIRIYLEGERLEFDVPPVIIDGRVMVPMRRIFMALGAPFVIWEEQSREIRTMSHSHDITLRIDNPVVALFTHPYNIPRENISLFISFGRSIRLEVPPQIVDNRTLVPLRAISELFTARVEWDEYTRTVYIFNRVCNELFHANWEEILQSIDCCCYELAHVQWAERLQS